MWCEEQRHEEEEKRNKCWAEEEAVRQEPEKENPLYYDIQTLYILPPLQSTFCVLTTCFFYPLRETHRIKQSAVRSLNRCEEKTKRNTVEKGCCDSKQRLIKLGNTFGTHSVAIQIPLVIKAKGHRLPPKYAHFVETRLDEPPPPNSLYLNPPPLLLSWWNNWGSLLSCLVLTPLSILGHHGSGRQAAENERISQWRERGGVIAPINQRNKKSF